jgi:hypothetical protein
MVCGVAVVAWYRGLCSPMVEIGTFEARIYGKGGGREIV